MRELGCLSATVLYCVRCMALNDSLDYSDFDLDHGGHGLTSFAPVRHS